MLNFKKIITVFLLLNTPADADNFGGLTSWINTLRTPNFSQIKDTDQRKKAFFEYLLPQIHQQNASIIKLRNDIKNNRVRQVRLQNLYKNYRVKEKNIDNLLSRIDIVPASLILAQGAYESDWGRSRFAKHYHNFFGLWCFKKGCGVVPLKRDKNATHEVAKFSSLAKGIEYYLLNINRNSAYTILRQIRKNKRDKNLPISGISLSEGLENYAQIGYDYVEIVQDIITYNKLMKYD